MFVATGGTGSAVNARPVVPETIPIVFAMGGDPIKLGMVASLARPGDNITGGFAGLLALMVRPIRVRVRPCGLDQLTAWFWIA